MLVKELIALLQKMPQDVEVFRFIADAWSERDDINPSDVVLISADKEYGSDYVSLGGR